MPCQYCHGSGYAEGVGISFDGRPAGIRFPCPLCGGKETDAVAHGKCVRCGVLTQNTAKIEGVLEYLCLNCGGTSDG